jgi:zinc-binding alcohol dehydrogenase family protein
MKAVVVQPDVSGDALRPTALLDVEMEIPVCGPNDLRVEVKAVAVNPIDLKMARAKPVAGKNPRVLGWDAAGTVQAVGSEVRGFSVGDRVYYAGSVLQAGCFSEFHLVDERLAAPAPNSLSWVEAAALPLSSLAAWEALFERMRIPQGSAVARATTLLVVGGAGGVGSMAIQLATQLTDLHVVATASRNESRDHCLAMGAHAVIDHTAPLATQLKSLGRPQVAYVLCLTEPSAVWSELAKVLAPFGHLCALVEAAAPLDMNLLRAKSLTFSWEGMFTRAMFRTSDMVGQQNILRRVAQAVDAGVLKTTLKNHLGPVDAQHLMQAHTLLATQRTVGKIVLG